MGIVIGLVKFKAAALLLGPDGIGLIGLLANIVALLSVVAGLGIATVGTQQVAGAAVLDDDRAVGEARQALFLAAAALALLGGVALWLLRTPIFRMAGVSGIADGDTALLALSIGGTVFAGAQTAYLNGIRRIGDLAIINVVGGLVATVVAITAIARLGEGGLAAFVLTGPAATLIVGGALVALADRSAAPPLRLPQLARQWRALASLGAPFMLASLVGVGGQLFVRGLLQRENGAADLGFFQAAWTISMNYMGVVLTAMGADYYPRLTGIIRDRTAARRLVNQQTEVALLFAGPILVLMAALAPLVVHILYAASFAPAATILRWQTMGDVLKIASWPLGFVLLASGRGVRYLLIEAAAMVCFCAVTFALLPRIGVNATGVAFVALYVVYLPLAWWQARSCIDFRWTGTNAATVLVLVALVGLVATAGSLMPVAGGLIGIVVALALGVRAARVLASATGMEAPHPALAHLSRLVLRR